jgi:hypothetical protein
MRGLVAWVVIVVLIGMCAEARAESITVSYAATAVTVVKQPFGLVVPRLTTVTGYFTFDTGTVDSEDEDPLEGAYQHDGTSGFIAQFLTNEITGSDIAFYEVDLSSDPTSDTFRVYDGPRPLGNHGGTMSLDGTEDPDIQLFFAATEDVFDDDALIDPFPAYDYTPAGTPHTFALEDDNGTMLLQLDSAHEVVCGDPSGGGGVTAGDALQVLRTAVGSQSCYVCACDVDANGTITSTDALKTLKFAVGGPALNCSICS